MMNKNTDIKAIMGQNIAKARKKLGFSQEKFAEQISISVSALSKIETGRNMPKTDTLTKIIKSLKVELYELFINSDFISKIEPKNDIHEKLIELIVCHKSDKPLNEAAYRYIELLIKCKKSR